MAAGAVLYLRCPFCTKTVEIQPFAGLCSVLGPPRFRCSRCGRIFSSGRQEWPDLTGKQKASYIVDSLFGMAICGIVGGAFTCGGLQFLKRGPWLDHFQRVNDLEVGLAIFVFVVLIAYIQVARVFLSLQRSRENEQRRMELEKKSKQKAVAVDEPGRPRLLLNVQGLVWLMAFCPLPLCWLIALLYWSIKLIL